MQPIIWILWLLVITENTIKTQNNKNFWFSGNSHEGVRIWGGRGSYFCYEVLSCTWKMLSRFWSVAFFLIYVHHVCVRLRAFFRSLPPASHFKRQQWNSETIHWKSLPSNGVTLSFWGPPVLMSILRPIPLLLLRKRPGWNDTDYLYIRADPVSASNPRRIATVWHYECALHHSLPTL